MKPIYTIFLLIASGILMTGCGGVPVCHEPASCLEPDGYKTPYGDDEACIIFSVENEDIQQ